MLSCLKTIKKSIYPVMIMERDLVVFALQNPFPILRENHYPSASVTSFHNRHRLAILAPHGHGAAILHTQFRADLLQEPKLLFT